MEDEKSPLSRRVPGAARAAPAASARPVLPEAVLARMRAAVDAERAETGRPILQRTSSSDSSAKREPVEAGDPETEPMPRIDLSAAASSNASVSQLPAKNGSVPHARIAKPKSRGKRNRGANPRGPSKADRSPEHHDPKVTDAMPTAPARPAPESDVISAGLSAPATESVKPSISADDVAPGTTQPLRRQPPGIREDQAPPERSLGPNPRGPTAPAAPPRPTPQLQRSTARPATGTPANAQRPSSAPTPARPGPQPRRSARPATGFRRLGGVGVISFVVVVIAAGSLAVALLTRGGAAKDKPPTALQKAELAVREQAAKWLASQVPNSTRVACDPAMCAAIEKHGFAASDLTFLGKTSGPPTSSALVIETSSVSTWLGTSFSAIWAPIVVDSLGKGTAHIDIRVMAPHQAPAYLSELRTDLTNRKTLGAGLIHLITVPAAAARSQMSTGEVDMRVLVTIVTLASHGSVDVVDFGNTATGASQGVPLRYVDLAANETAIHMTPDAYLKWTRSVLSRQPVAYRPLWTNFVGLPGGPEVLRVEFGAPTPLGLQATPQA